MIKKAMRYFSPYIFVLLFLFVNCSGYSRTYPIPTTKEVLTTISPYVPTTLRSSGTIDYRVKGKRYKGKVFLIAEHNGRLRLEVISPPPMNATLLLATNNGSIIKVWNGDTNEYYQGISKPCILLKLLGFPGTAQELYSLLTNTPPYTKNATLSWDKKCGCEKITTYNNSIKWIYYVNGKNGNKNWKLLKVIGYLPNGKLIIEYRGFFKYKSKWFAKRTRIRYQKNDIVFSWDKLDFDKEFSDDAFDQDIAINAKVFSLKCGDANEGL